MAFLGNFAIRNVDEVNTSDLIPRGDYRAAIESSDLTSNDKQTQTVTLVWTILEGGCKGRKVYDRITVDSPSSPNNDKVHEMYERKMGSCAKACGIHDTLEDTVALHNVPCTISVDIDDKNPQYPAKNIVKAYKQASGAPSVMKPQTAPQTAASKPSWMK